MAVMEMNGQVAPEVPRLVVSIVVDQLRTDYMQAFLPLYGQEGFARLMREGRAFTRAQYPFASPDRASAIASLMTGTSPYDHGIVGERWLSRENLQPVYCVDDRQYAGHGTAEHVAPTHLLVSTLSDELKVATQGRALVYSVAPTSDAAVLGAGHAADGAFWISDQTGGWCTTSYYGSAPAWLGYYNNSRNLQQQIAQLTWQPVNELTGSYNYFLAGGQMNKGGKAFRHTFKGERRFRQFKASGLVNEEVTNMAQHVLRNTLMGIDAVPDLLSLTYYAGTYDQQSLGASAMELQDTYVRLDAQLALLMQRVEEKVGKGRALFVLTGTGSAMAQQDEEDLRRYRIPSGEFNISRAHMLLNMYLSAVYGQAQWIEASYGNHIYVNQKLIENRGISLSELLDRSQAFLLQLSGVRDVFTSQRLLMGAGQTGVDRLRNAYNPRCSGDILVQVAPGWQLVHDTHNQRSLTRDGYLPFPLFFLGTNIEHEIVNTPVTVDRVAPTISAHLRIRAPNASMQMPLQ